MILTCPECSAKYMVATDTIGEKGRDVRCAKCGHMWHQRSERDSLDDLINRIQSEEMDDIDFGDGGNLKPQKEKVSTPRRSFAEMIGPLLDKVTALQIILKSKILPNPPKFIVSENLRRISKGTAAGSLLFLICAGAAILAHGPIMGLFPSTEPVFTALGLEREVPQEMNIEDMLAFDHLSYEPEKGGDGLLSGTLINLTAAEVSVPPVTVEILNEKNEVVWTKQLALTSESLDSEGQIDFEVRLDKLPTLGAAKLELRFGPAGQDEEHHSPAEEG